jgi:hypothetical protein
MEKYYLIKSTATKTAYRVSSEDVLCVMDDIYTGFKFFKIEHNDFQILCEANEGKYVEIDKEEFDYYVRNAILDLNIFEYFKPIEVDEQGVSN